MSVLEHIAFEMELKLAGDAAAPGTFSGYASVWGIMDLGGDIVMPGAFKASLAEWRKRKALPSLLWQHNSQEPIGVWTSMKEDDKGLAVEGELILDDVPEAKKAHALMKRGAVKGLSIGYRTRDYELDRTTGARRLKQVDLFEVSVVTSPMLPEAQVSTVKGMLPSDRELESLFRDGAGISNRQAKACVAELRKALRDGGSGSSAHRDDDAAAAAARAFEDMTRRLRS